MDSGPAPFSCAWSVPVMSVLRDAELVSWSTELVTGALVRLESLLGWGTELVGLEHTELVRLLVRLGHRAG